MPQEFASRALRIQHEAIRLSRQISGGYAEVNK
jgi:hypothetical protein